MFNELAGNDGIELLPKGERLGVGDEQMIKAAIAELPDFLFTLVDAHDIREAFDELAVQPMRRLWLYGMAGTSHIENTGTPDHFCQPFCPGNHKSDPCNFICLL